MIGISKTNKLAKGEILMIALRHPPAHRHLLPRLLNLDRRVQVRLLNLQTQAQVQAPPAHLAHQAHPAALEAAPIAAHLILAVLYLDQTNTGNKMNLSSHSLLNLLFCLLLLVTREAPSSKVVKLMSFKQSRNWLNKLHRTFNALKTSPRNRHWLSL